MRHAVFLPAFGAFGEPALLVELAVVAEASGWDGFFLWDHLVQRVDGPYVDAWIALAAIAARTERIRLGPLVTPIPRRRPWKLAREAASVDQLSRGRLVLGVGIGTDRYGEFGAFSGEASTDRERADLLDEGLEIVTRLWTGERVVFPGQRLGVDGVRFLPRPVQQSRVPVWCAAVWPHERPLLRAARYDGVAPLGDITPAAVRDLRERIAAHRTADGPFDVALASFAAGDSPQAAYEAAGATWCLESFLPDTPRETAQRIVERGPAR